MVERGNLTQELIELILGRAREVDKQPTIKEKFRIGAEQDV